MVEVRPWRPLFQRRTQMKVYGDLVLSGPPEALLSAVAAIEQGLSTGWERSREFESRIHAADARCFVAPETASHPAGALWLAKREQGDWYVANIVPIDAGGLTEDQYNSILTEFYERFVRGVAESAGVKAVLGKTDKGPADYMSSAAVDSLDRFSALANKSTGSGHPADQERWFDFIIQIHNDQRGPDAGTLVDLLSEYFGWPHEKASELASEYEFGRALLRQAYRR
jgi:hypothetical protein